MKKVLQGGGDFMNVDLLWNKFLERIKNDVNSMVYKTYFECTKLISKEENKLIFSVPNDICRKRLDSYYYDIINAIFLELTNQTYDLKFILEEEVSQIVKPKQESLFDSFPLNNVENSNIQNENTNITYKHQSNLIKDYTFDNFIVGNSNKLAHGAAFAVAEEPGKHYNPLFLYGNSGLGKTHLMHAVGNYIEQNSNKSVLYIRCDQFVDDFMKMSLDPLNYSDYFKNKYRNPDVLIIDDIQFLAKKNKTQDEFFHTFNCLYQNHKQIIVSSDRSPNDIKELADRLKTRFTWGLTVNIYPPELELRKEIVYKKIHALNIQKDIPDEVVEYISSNIASDVRAIEQAVNHLTAYSVMMGGIDITLETAVEALRDFINKGTSEETNILKIQRGVADYFQISVDDLKGRKRSSNIAFPRQIAMYLSRTLLNASFEQIGLEFGGKDHTTVMHSCEKIRNEVNSNKEIYNSIEKIKENIS